MTKKAQAAMEFLMTYGWAILVVLVVIGALAFFGILKPETSLPERCELQQGFYCKDYRLVDSPSAGQDFLVFTFENGRGSGMMVSGVIARGTGELSNAVCDNNTLTKQFSWSGRNGLHIENGESAIVAVNCGSYFDDLSGTGKKKFDLEIDWYAADDITMLFNHTMQGQLLAGIEQQ